MGNINWEYAIGIVGVIATVWGILYIIKPNLKYFIEILPFVNPRDVDKNIKSKLKITYDNQEVSQLSLARVTICNKGKAVAENFSSPIIIKFSKKILYVVPNVEILKSGIVHEYTISNDRFRIEFTPQYINQGESIYFDVVIESAKDIEVSVTGRCKGCSHVKKIQENKKIKIVKTIIFVFLILINLVLIDKNIELNKKTKFLTNTVDITKKEILNKYKKLYRLYENDEKEINQTKEKIQTPQDVVEAYISCENKLKFYIDIAKKHITENAKFFGQDISQHSK